MNSFIENVNYVAGLDNLYGSGIELYKNNLSLKSVQHDIELKFSYYDDDDKKIHSIVHSEPGVLFGGIEDMLLSFKTLVESSITGSEFTCTVNFVINNISMVNINIVSNSDEYKTYELEMKIVTAGVVTYDVFGEVKDSLKILPSLAMITSLDVDVMANVYEIREEIVTVASNIVGLNSIVSNMTEILLADDNAAIATAKALESSDSAAASLQSEIDAAASAAGAFSSATTAITKASEALVSANNAATSDTNASISATQSATSAVQSSSSATSANDSAVSASNSAVSANDSAGEALISKNSATASASTAAFSATSALSSEDKAEKWATETEDVEVEPGKYSAMHWALKAEEIGIGTASAVLYDNATSGLTADNAQEAIDEIDTNFNKLVSTANVFRADKVLASKDVANMIYSAGNLVKIRYTTDVDVDYEVLTYSGSDLVNVAHYVDSVFKGDTVLTYSGGELVSSIFVGV